MELLNKIIIVTGGSGLLGREMVRALESKGAKVLNFDINHETDIEKGLVYCNITETASVDSAINLAASCGEIFGLVNNAYPRTKDWGTAFEEISLESWRTNVDLQLNCVFYITQQVLLRMKESKQGSIVNIASIYGVVGNDFTMYEGTKIATAAPYSAIKGGLINLTRYLASLYGKHNIRLNCVSPGGIFDNQDPVFVSNYEQRVPMKRMGLPDDISGVVSFLFTQDAKYISGQNLIVDGGWTAI